MSKKSTKIIAAAGVVAGLGVAALPAMTFATETVNGSVDVITEVVPAIAMTITGNNDDGSHHAAPSGTTYGGIDVFNPATAASSSIDGHTTPAQPTTTVSSSWYTVLPNAVLNGNDTNGFKSTIMVYTNAAGGYNLNVKDADSTLSLTREGDDTQPAIPAGTITDPATTFNLTPGTAAWGYVVDTASSDGTGYKAIKAIDELVKQQSAPTSAEANRKTTVYYGVATDNDQPTGFYKDTIIYTATTR